jgi:hypothetical protein
MSISSYGSCAHLISGGGISFTAICTIKEALAIELALNIAAGTAEAQTKTSTNTQIIPVCPHAKIMWVVCDCGIKSELAYDFLDCTGEGTYSVPGNGGYGYSRQCGKVVPGKPA